MIRTPQTIFQRAPGARDANGRWVDGPLGQEPLIIRASVQPATTGDYDQLRAMPSGRRIERVVRIYTSTRLNVAGENDNNGDVLLWEGGRYLVIAVSPWRTTALRHFRYWASKELES